MTARAGQLGTCLGRKGPPQLLQGSFVRPSDRRSFRRGGSERPRRELELLGLPVSRDEWMAHTGSVLGVVSDVVGVLAAWVTVSEVCEVLPMGHRARLF